MLVREPDSPDYRTFISSFIDEHSPALREVSLSIHSNPELGYKEFHAVETLCSFLQSRPGWTVQQGVYGIYTAFVARFGEYGDDDDDGAHVSFNAEYGRQKKSSSFIHTTRQNGSTDHGDIQMHCLELDMLAVIISSQCHLWLPQLPFLRRWSRSVCAARYIWLELRLKRVVCAIPSSEDPQQKSRY